MIAVNAATPLPESLLDALKQVVDPENGINIVDLGLIHEIRIDAERVVVRMTMTSAACPMADMIIEDVDATLAALLPRGMFPDIELVWEPAWDPSRMSDAARAQFGW